MQRKMDSIQILIVEDEALVAMEIERYLLDLGYQVAGIVSTGEKALKSVEAQAPDLILMDIRISGAMDGIETASIVRSRWRCPVVFLTAFLDDSRLEQAKHSMPFGYLLKPVNKRELKVTIEMALHMAEADQRRFESEQALRESEEKLRITLASIGDAVLSTDIEGHISNMNAVAENLTGWPLDEALGKPLDTVFQIIDETSRQPVKSPVDEVLASGKTVSLANHTLLVDRNGREIPIADSGAPIRDKSGRISGVVLVFRDQTEERQLRKQLEESETKYRTAFKTSPDAVNINRLDGLYVDINDGFTQLTGFTREDCIGKLSSEIDIWANPADRERLVAGLKKEGRVDNLEASFRFKDGTVKTGLMSASIIHLNDEPHILSVTRDISDRKQAEETLREQKELMELITQTSPIGIAVVDSEGRITFANKAAEDILGLEAKQITQRFYNDPQWKIVDLDGNPFPDESLPFSQIMEKKEAVFDVQHSIEWPDGRRHILSINAAPLLDADGRVTGMVSTLNDITERVDADQQIHKLLDEKETLLKEVHHRIKNNVMTVQSLLSLQAMGSTNEESVQTLEKARDRLQSMMILYDKLYRSDDFYQMSIKAYLPELIDDILRQFAHSVPLTITKRVDDIVLNTNTLSSIGIITNELLTNSMKYAYESDETGEIIISAYREDQEIILVVEDKGKGLPADFELEQSEGFGLKLVQMMVDQFNGKLQIEKNGGTRFVISLAISD